MHPLLHALSCWHKNGKDQIIYKKVLQKSPEKSVLYKSIKLKDSNPMPQDWPVLHTEDLAKPQPPHICKLMHFALWSFSQTSTPLNPTPTICFTPSHSACWRQQLKASNKRDFILELWALRLVQKPLPYVHQVLCGHHRWTDGFSAL